jgi:hypothetical protein
LPNVTCKPDMTANKSSDKKIVYENRLRLFGLLIISWGFVIMCALTAYYWGLLFFGLCAIVTTYPLIDPKKKIIFTGTKEYKDHIEKEFQEKRKDLGIFTYTDNGFQVKILEQQYNVIWTDIQAMFGYKVDQYALDEICMDVFCNNDVSFRVTEESAGWYVFQDRVFEKFPSIKQNWYIEIAFPAFATNLTLLYEKHNKTLDEASKHYYKDVN